MVDGFVLLDSVKICAYVMIENASVHREMASPLDDIPKYAYVRERFELMGGGVEAFCG